MTQTSVKEKQEKIKDTPWTKLGVKVDLCSFLTRKVLVEKYNSKKAKETEMREFFLSKIDGCELFTNSEYPDYVFYMKKDIDGNNEILMKKCEKNKTFYIKYAGIWSVFESLYMLQYNDIQSFTQITIEEGIKLHGYKTKNCFTYNFYDIEEGIKLHGYKT